MLIKFSDNIFKQASGVIYHNRYQLLSFTIISTLAVAQYKLCLKMGWFIFEMPIIPVSILGGALAIFLAFRNSSAYDRWWEARKIWGGIVNSSRTLGMMILSFGSTHFTKDKVTDGQVKAWQKDMIYRHMAWLQALILHLRKQSDSEILGQYLDKEEHAHIYTATNRPVQLIHTQGQKLQEGYELGIIEDFRHMELVNLMKELYNFQGKAERIKNTVFPYYYNYFTRLFLWLFVLTFPFALVTETGSWVTIPMSIAICFVFSILEKSGTATEDPFEGRAADTPISTIARGIEIDLREMLGEKDIPKPLPIKFAMFAVEYID